MGLGAGGHPPDPMSSGPSAVRPERLGEGALLQPEDRLAPFTPARCTLGVKSQALNLHVKSNR